MAPYTIARQIVYPDRQCVAFVGDGGFTMLMGEFATAVKYDLPIKVIIIKNNTRLCCCRCWWLTGWNIRRRAGGA
jgi:thiamine pyrophosphate-dependent acetolactate synthase large subunit-like protein